MTALYLSSLDRPPGGVDGSDVSSLVRKYARNTFGVTDNYIDGVIMSVDGDCGPDPEGVGDRNAGLMRGQWCLAELIAK